MAFASTEDVADWLGRDLTAAETPSVELLLDLATAMIADAAGENDAWAEALDPVPDVLRGLTLVQVARVMANPNGLRNIAENLGQFNYSAAFRPEGLGLTDLERAVARRAAGLPSSGSSRPRSVIGDFYPEAS
jgi:hypothetical protein